MKIETGLKKTAAMVILRCEQQFLLLKRAKAPNQGMYVPVGGKLEAFEGPRAAAIRETYEETGIRVEQLHFCGILTESSPTRYNWTCHIYLCDIPYQQAPPCPEGQLEWIAFEDIPHIPTPPTDHQIYLYTMRQQAFVMDAYYNEDLQLLSMTEEIEGKRLI